MAGYLLGYDIGSSAVKAALVEADSGAAVGSAVSPADELPIQAPRPGWAEQDPDVWWRHVCAATRQLAAAHPESLRAVRAIGLSYQMHGLVLVDARLAGAAPGHSVVRQPCGGHWPPGLRGVGRGGVHGAPAQLTWEISRPRS